MIFKLPLSQIAHYWPAIKFAAVQAEGVKEENIPAFSIDLLFNILKEEVLCLISINEQREIQRLLICTILFDSVLQSKVLFFRTLYGFEKGTPDEWAKESMQVYNFAKKENCSVITMTTSNPRIVELAKQYGFSQTSNNFVIKI